jgi:short subunit dehydrogenase-like uncharacterized protein
VSSIAVVGAGGLVGGLITELARTSGIEVVEVTRATFASGRAAVERAVSGTSTVVNAATGEPETAEALLAAATAGGADLVDVVPEQAHIRRLVDADPRARDAGIAVVVGAGLQHLIGDTLAHLAGDATDAPREIHVAYTLPDRGGLLADASAGRRRSAARELLAPSAALVDGRLRSEPIGEHRRLAWFPRPVGPAHAASVPGGEAITVPRHVAGLGTVRTYVALTGWRCELLQAAANLARAEPIARRLTRRISATRSPMGEARRAAIRWGAVAEANGAGGVARAWAYGHDPYRLTAVAALRCVELLRADPARSGVWSPAELGAPGELLDLLATGTDLRWSISRPDPEALWPRS